MVTDEQILEAALPFGAFEYGDAQGHKRIAFARAVLAIAAPAPVAQADALRDAAMYEAGRSDALTCHLPPHGWRCTRTAGHDGPCAAVECPEDIELVARGMDRLRDTPAAPAPVTQPLCHACGCYHHPGKNTLCDAAPAPVAQPATVDLSACDCRNSVDDCDFPDCKAGRSVQAAPAPVALTNTDRAMGAFRAMRSKDAIAHRERMANAPKGACESCYGEGEIGGQFCGGFEPCAECSGTGRANGIEATGQEGGAT